MQVVSRVVVGVLLIVSSTVAYGKPPYFSDEKAAELAKLLPTPPAENCPETQAELDLIVRCQQACTPQEIAQIGLEGWMLPIDFQKALGSWFSEENLPQTMQLLAKVNRQARHCTNVAKQEFHRRRPRFLDERIKPVFIGTDEPCYPSGHATQATALAEILSELVPSHRDALIERACQIGWNRIPAGLHYPSDCIAGRVLGQAVAQTLLADASFREELSQAHQEINRVRQESSAMPTGPQYH